MLKAVVMATILVTVDSLHTSLNRFHTCYKVHDRENNYIAFTASSNLTLFPPFMKLQIKTSPEVIDDKSYIIHTDTYYIVISELTCTRTLQLNYERKIHDNIMHEIHLYIGNNDFVFTTYKIWQRQNMPRSIHEIRDPHGVINIMVEFGFENEGIQPVAALPYQITIPKYFLLFQHGFVEHRCVYCIHENRVFALNFTFAHSSSFLYSPMVNIKISLYLELSDYKSDESIFETRFDGWYLQCSNSIFNDIHRPNILYKNEWANFYLVITITDTQFKNTLESVYHMNNSRMQFLSSRKSIYLGDFKIHTFNDRGDIVPSKINTLILSRPHIVIFRCSIERFNPIVWLERYYMDEHFVESNIAVHRCHGNPPAILYRDIHTFEDFEGCDWLSENEK